MGYYPKTAIGSGKGGSGKASVATGAPASSSSGSSGGSGGSSSGSSGGSGGGSSSTSSQAPSSPTYESPLAKNRRETAERQAAKAQIVSDLRKSGYTGTRAEIAAQQISEGRQPIQANIQEREAFQKYNTIQTQRAQDTQARREQQTFEENVQLVQAATGATSKESAAYVRTLPEGTVLVGDRQKIDQARNERMNQTTPTPSPTKAQALKNFQQNFRTPQQKTTNVDLLTMRGLLSLPAGGIPLVSNKERLPTTSDKVDMLLSRGQNAGGLVGVGSYFALQSKKNPFKLAEQAATVYTLGEGALLVRGGAKVLAQSPKLLTKLPQAREFVAKQVTNLPKLGKKGAIPLLSRGVPSAAKTFAPKITQPTTDLVRAAPRIKDVASRIGGSITTKYLPEVAKGTAKGIVTGIGSTELARQYVKSTTSKDSQVGLTKDVRAAGFAAEIKEVEKLPIYKKIPYGFSVLTVNDKAYREGVKQSLMGKGLTGSQLTQAVEASARERKLTGRVLLASSVQIEYLANELGESFIADYFKRNVGKTTQGAFRTGAQLFGNVGIRTLPAGVMEGVSQDVVSRYQTSSEVLSKRAFKSYGESAALGGVFSSVAGGAIAGFRPKSNLLSKSVLFGSYLGDFPGEPLGDLASYAKRGLLRAAKNTPEVEPTILKRMAGKTPVFTLGLSQGGKVIAPASFLSPVQSKAQSAAKAPTSTRRKGSVPGGFTFGRPSFIPTPSDTPPNVPPNVPPAYTPESILNPSQSIPPEIPPQVPPDVPPLVPTFTPISINSAAVGLDRAFLPPLVPLPGIGGGGGRYGKESRRYVNELSESLKVLTRSLRRRR